jgi:integrase
MEAQRGKTMATITRRGKGWYAQVRRSGFPPRFRTFGSKLEATAWARAEERSLEAPIEQGTSNDHLTLADLLRRYRDTVSVSKRGASSEAFRLSKLLATPMAALVLRDLRPWHVAAYRDQRLKAVKPGTVRREMGILRSALEMARREWGLLVDNPAAAVARPVAYDARDRRVSKDEWRRMEPVLLTMRNKEVEWFIRLALETALRRGELLALLWRHVDLERRVALIPDTKTGQPRTIPLTPEAHRILAYKERAGERVVNLTPVALRRAWERLCARARVEDLRVHDLRHEALSRFSELGLNTPELASISGHKDVRMLLRYTHVQPSALALKLAALAGAHVRPIADSPGPGVSA